jgi:hypothetical protein
MNTVFFDSSLADDARRRQLYRGQLFVFSPYPSARGTDLAHLPDEIVALYDDEPPTDGELIYQPSTLTEDRG